MISRRYESYTNRSLPVFSTRPGMVFEHSPIFKTVSIIPGIDIRAPLRQETNSGFSGSPNFIPMTRSVLRRAFSTCSSICGGNFILFSKKSVQQSVVIVNPAGTGRPRLHISARLAPLPPSKFFISERPSALPGPKKYTYLGIRILPFELQLLNLCENAYRATKLR